MHISCIHYQKKLEVIWICIDEIFLLVCKVTMVCKLMLVHCIFILSLFAVLQPSAETFERQ